MKFIFSLLIGLGLIVFSMGIRELFYLSKIKDLDKFELTMSYIGVYIGIIMVLFENKLI